MSPQYPEPPAPHLLRQADRYLSGLVVNVEFTMISIITGLILVILVDNAAPIVRNLQFEYWPYALLSLLMIMRSWDDKMGHVLAFVRWPMDLGHNLLYIGQAFIQGLLLKFLNDPQAFFAFSVVYWLWVVGIAAYDRRPIQYHKARAQGLAVELFIRAERRQQRLLRTAMTLVPIMILAAAATLLLPEVFITAHGHLFFIIPLCVAYLYATFAGIRSVEGLGQEMLVKTAEELAAEQASSSPSPEPQPAQKVVALH